MVSPVIKPDEIRAPPNAAGPRLWSMAVVTLRPPLRDLAGGHREVLVDADSVGLALRALEQAHPQITGWILDEHGRVRPHVSVFVDGARVTEKAELAPDDVIHVLPAISGGVR
jgi:molybdopterin converting factor small subunit